jgi:hypothetical protein
MRYVEDGMLGILVKLASFSFVISKVTKNLYYEVCTKKGFK